MPNWVKNKVRAVNKNDTAKLIAMLVKSDDEGKSTNFNGIIPMPEELRNSTAGFGNPEWEVEHKRNREKYGFSTWYDFACAKWGTKWDNNAVYIDNGVIEFETPWSIPDGVYQKISETIPIIVAYADEDIGSNCGILQFEGDDCDDIMIDGTSTQLANAVWGYEYDPDWEFSEEDDYSDEVNDALYNILHL